MDVKIAQQYDEVVEHCEDKCRVQIYGRNVTNNEECLAYNGDFNQQCLDNCTFTARVNCANQHHSGRELPTRLSFLYIDPSSIVVLNASENMYNYDGTR